MRSPSWAGVGAWGVSYGTDKREFTPAVDGTYSVAIWADGGGQIYDLTTTVA